MPEVYIGEIRLFPWAYTPTDLRWQSCDGTFLSIRDFEALFSILGNRFGGDGKTTFAVPDMRGRLIVNAGLRSSRSNAYRLADTGGAENVALTITTMPQHAHKVTGLAAAGTINPIANDLLASCGVSSAIPDPQKLFAPPSSKTPLNPKVVTVTGQGLAHDNMQPFLVLNFCIALEGVYPPRT